MPTKPDTASIGQDRAIQNPADAMPGTYTDAVNTMPEGERLPINAMPQAPDPDPFTVTGGGTGGRSE